MKHEPSPARIEQEKVWRSLGLRDEEYQLVKERLGRSPNWVELGMFAVLWSEHCAYKHSRPLLGQLPTEGEAVLVGPGENAGVIDAGDVAVAFRIESHNHPSAVEPYHGAATGVGGILRDVLAVGARPIALLGSLRFGPLEDEKVRVLLDGVTDGAADYANEVGVPTVGGELVFEPAYRNNPLVNVMCVGVLKKERLTLARASGVGNTIMLIGAKTGRDGILAASFASEELGETSEEDRPSVVVGDPALEKRLIEACLELMEQPGIVGVQDMGAAGIASSVSETAARAGNGAEIDVALVPVREEGMTPYEILLSESQERMLVVVERGREEAVRATCRKWGVDATVIGRVTGDGFLRVRRGEEVVAEVPVHALSSNPPTYRTPSRRPAYLDDVPVFREEEVSEPKDWTEALRRVLGSPNVASKAWVYEHYDCQERSGTVLPPGHGAAVVRLPASKSAVVMSTDGNGRYCYLDPFLGAAHSVAEAARNVVCAGAKPVAMTNGLNLGNPEKPEVYWQLEKVIEGMAEACRRLQTPVTGGNVSLYNETSGEPIYPTPIVGMVGLLKDAEEALSQGWEKEGWVLLLLGDCPHHLGGSEYLRAMGYPLMGPVPHLDLDLEARLQALMLNLHQDGHLRAARDVSDGGLLTALAEGAFIGGEGFSLCLENLPVRADVFFFGEGGSRIVVAVEEARAAEVEKAAEAAGVPVRRLGRTGGQRLTLTVDGHVLIDEPLAALREPWETGLTRWMVSGAEDRRPPASEKGKR